MVAGSPCRVTVGCSAAGEAAGRLDRDAETIGSRCDAAEHAAVAVASRVRDRRPPSVRDERRRCSALPRSGGARRSRRRTRTPSHRRQRQQRLGQVGLELVEDRLAQPGGTPVATSSPTPPIESWSLRTSSISAIIRAAAAGSGQRTTGVRLDLLERDRRRVGDVARDVADLLDVAERRGRRCRARSFLATAPAATRQMVSRALDAAAAAVVAEAVLGVEGEVGVAGAVLVLDVAVVVAALVARCGTGCRCDVPSVLPSKTPDQISGVVLLVALGDDLRLPRPAAAQVGQQVVDGQRQPRRAAVDDDDVARGRG